MFGMTIFVGFKKTIWPEARHGSILKAKFGRLLSFLMRIFYRNKQQQADQIANLSKVLGQDELLDRTFSTSPSIIFKQQANMEKL